MAMNEYESAITALERGDLDKGVSILQKLREETPEDPTILYNLGMAYSDLGLLKKAIETLQQCVELRGTPNDRTALGVAYFRNKQMTEARAQFEEALSKEPDNFYALRNYGVILAQSGDVDSAISRFTEALKINPTAPEVLYAMGQAFEQKEDLQTADEWYKKIIDLGGVGEIRHLAKEARTRIAGQEVKSSGFRMDAMMYCLAALELFEKVDEITPIVADIAFLGQRGLDIHDPERKYSLKSLEGKFSGMQLLCYMYVGFQQIDPSMDVGIDLKDEYEAALKMHKGGTA